MIQRRVVPAQHAAVRGEVAEMAKQLRSGNTLELGDTGKAVVALQRHLSAAGLYTGKASGTFDEATGEAVKKLQKAKGLEQTGRVGSAELAAVKDINLFVKDGFDTPAKRGQRGSDILRAERMLEKAGFKPGKVDGVFDADTLGAVQRFRRADAQVPDKGNAINSKLFGELKKLSASYDHAPFRRRDKTDLAQHARQDARTAERAASGQGLGVGAKGSSVENLERHLNAAGYSVGRANTAFGARTEAAVKAFQKAVGLEETGRVDKRTWSKLTGSLFRARSDTSPVQREGEKSSAVLRTERYLQKLKLDTGKVDGHFTAKTEQAVKQFQRRNDLEATGEVNGRTLSALKEKATRITKPDMIWKPSPNQNSRGGVDVDAIILHHTASNSTAGDLATLRSPAAQVSAHYLIGRDGKIYQLVKDERRAWHAGEAAIRGDRTPDVNSRSIGIEITNAGDGKTPFTQKQYEALEKLVPYLMKKHKVPMKNLLGHKDVAIPAGRKSDPASNFNWERIRRAASQV